MSTIKRKNIYLCSLLLLCVLGLYSCDQNDKTVKQSQQFETIKTYNKGPLSLTVQLDHKQLNIAQTLTVRLETIITEDHAITLPAIEKLYDKEEFSALEHNLLPEKLLADKKHLIVATYRLEPLKPGALTIPEIAITFTSKETKTEYELLLEPISITVSDLLDPEKPDLTISSIKDIASLPDYRFIPYLIITLIALVAIIIAIIFWYRRYHLAIIRERIFRPAHELAFARLRTLNNQDLPGNGKIKLFYEQLSNILRFYIEHRFALRAPEQTTEEFMDDLRTTNKLNSDNRQMLEEFLQQCDMVKFAKHIPPRPGIDRSYELAERFIDLTSDIDCKIKLSKSQQQEIKQGGNW